MAQVHQPRTSLKKNPSMKHWVILIFSLLLGLLGCNKQDQKQAQTETEKPIVKTFTIAVIPKGTNHEFWKSIHAGAIKAAREMGNVNIDWKGPQKEDDRDAQITVVEDFISKRVDGIVLAPLDNTALARPVADASSNNIPVVIIDSGLESDVYRSFISTDNFKAGAMAAKEMGKLCNGQGKALIMRYMEGSASTMERENGFLQTLKLDFPEIEILSDNQYAGPTTETALQTAENLLIRFPQANAIFCPNESSTFGMLKALRDINKAGNVQFIGFDASRVLVEGLKAGEIKGLIVQNPLKMGYLGVKTMVSILKGETVEKVIETGAELVTQENMAQPEIAELLNPPLDQYLVD